MSMSREEAHREFIRKLANDYLHYKIYGNEQNTISEVIDSSITQQQQQRTPARRRYGRVERASTSEHVVGANQENSANDVNNNESSVEDVPFHKTAKLLRKVSVELERTNSNFFDNVCTTLNLGNTDPERTFKSVSEEVLSREALNWGRVVSLFTFGGKVAEWFWTTQQEDKIEELEDWLTESISSKEEWILQKGGWENFNSTFANGPREEDLKITWWKSGLLVCVGVSLAALFTMKMN